MEPPPADIGRPPVVERSKRVRLAYLTVSFPCGIREQFLGPELRALREHCEVLLVPIRPGPCAPPDLSGWDLAVVRPWSWSAWRALLTTAVRRPGALLRLASAVSRTSPRNAVRNLSVLPKACWLALTIREREIDHVHAQWGTTPSTVAMVAAGLSGIPWSFTVHRHDVLANNLLAAKGRSAAFVRFPSFAALDDATNLAGPLPASRVLLEHMGVEVPDAPAAIDAGSRVVICPAALVPRKGQATLVRALALAPTIELWLAGAGPDRTRLERLAQAEGVDARVRFLDFVPHDHLLGLYDSGQVWAVALATEHEGIPFALMEAMAHGVPVVSTPVGGIPELLSDEAGLVVPTGDPQALAGALSSLAEHAALHGDLAAAGRARIRAEFDLGPTTAALAAAIARSTYPPSAST